MMERMDRLFVAALALVTIAYLALFGYYLGATSLRVPVFDTIYWVLQYVDYWVTGDWWNYLWLPHNEHRIVWSRLLLIADIEWFGGTTLAFLLVNTACLLVVIAALVREVMASDLAPAVRVTMALMVVLLLATSFNAIYCSVPMMDVFLHTCTFMVLALVLWDGEGDGARHPIARRVLALLAGIVAAFGVSGGILVWPLLLWAAWRGGLRWGWIVAPCLIGAGLAAVYLPGMDRPSVVTDFDPTTLLRMADYFVRFLGLPWSHAPALVNPGRVVGLTTLFLGGYAIVRFGVLQRPRNRLERVAIGLILFGFMTAGLITLGRLNTAPEREMPIRYALFTSLVQVGLVLFAAPWLQRVWAGRGRRLAQSAILAAGALFLAQQVVGGRAGVENIQRYATAYKKFEAGIWTDDMRMLVGKPIDAQRALDFTRAHGLYRGGS
jgi:hypothetical protein